jgi:hypothetical protein
VLAGGTDDQVGIGEIMRKEVGRDALLGHVFGGDAAGDDVANGGDKLLPAAVVERQCQHQPVVVPGARDRLAHRLGEIRPQALETADMAELGTLAVELVRLTLDHLAQYPHDSFDFLGRAAPVVGREGPEREIPNPQFYRGVGDAPNIVGAPLVPRDAG